MSDAQEHEPWEPEVLAWLAELAGGVVGGGGVEGGDRVRIARGSTTVDAFVSLHRRNHGERMPAAVTVLLRARTETSPDESAAEQGPFRSGAASTRRRVRGRPRIMLGERVVTGGGTIVEPDRPLPPGEPRLAGVCFASDAPDAEVLEVLGSPGVQSRIAELLEQHCASVSVNGGGEWLVVRVVVQPLVAEEGPRLRAIVEAFLALWSALPLFGPAPRRSWLSRLPGRLFWLSPLAGIPTAIAGVSWRPTIDLPLALVGGSAALWALSLTVAWLVRRRGGRMGGKRRRVLFGLAFMLGLGPLSVCLGLGLLVNGCDPGALEHRSAQVISKHRHKSRNYFDVRELQPGASGLKTIKVADDLWERTKPGEHVVLVVGPGRLGWPWLARVEAAPR